jgi:hypothetical protein
MSAVRRITAFTSRRLTPWLIEKRSTTDESAHLKLASLPVAAGCRLAEPSARF